MSGLEEGWIKDKGEWIKKEKDLSLLESLNV